MLQQKPFHSHNDYWRDVPFYSGLAAGAISTECDVWNIDGILYVGLKRYLKDHIPFLGPACYVIRVAIHAHDLVALVALRCRLEVPCNQDEDISSKQAQLTFLRPAMSRAP